MAAPSRQGRPKPDLRLIPIWQAAAMMWLFWLWSCYLNTSVDVLSERVEWNWNNVPMRGGNGLDTFADHFGRALEISVIANSIPILLIQITRQREASVLNTSFVRAHSLVLMDDLEALLAPREH